MKKKTASKEHTIKQLADDQREFIHKCFMLPGVQKGFHEWFSNNMIYSEDTESFVHTLFDCFKQCRTYDDAENQAFRTLEFMRLKFLYAHYNIESLKEQTKDVEYIPPLEQLKKKTKEC